MHESERVFTRDSNSRFEVITRFFEVFVLYRSSISKLCEFMVSAFLIFSEL